MTTQVHFKVNYKPDQLNYEIYTGAKKDYLLFKTSKSKMNRFVKDLKDKENCKLKGNKGEELIVAKGKNNPARKQILEYLELILEKED